MIKLDLQAFAKSASEMKAYRASIKMAKNQMPGPKVESKSKEKEQKGDAESRILDSRGYVKKIEFGQRYNMYNANRNGEVTSMFYDKVPAAEVKELLEGYTYNEKDSTFTNESGDRLLIKLIRKKKK